MRSDHLDLLKSVFDKQLNPAQHRAFIFGSFAKSEEGKFSDLDIGIEGRRLSPETYFTLLEEIENSALPFVVELVQFCDVSGEFRKKALGEIIPINY